MNILRNAIDDLVSDLAEDFKYADQSALRRTINYWAHKHIEQFSQEHIAMDSREINDVKWIRHKKKQMAFTFAEKLAELCGESKQHPLKKPSFTPIDNDVEGEFYGPRALKLSVQVFAFKREPLKEY